MHVPYLFVFPSRPHCQLPGAHCLHACSPNGFQIVVSGSEVYLCTDTAQQRDEWLEALYGFCASVGIGRPMVAKDQKTRIVRYWLTCQISMVSLSLVVSSCH